jgi:hypothetical protein
LQDKTFQDAKGFLDKLGNESLDEFPLLLKQAEHAYGSSGASSSEANASANASTKGDQNVQAMTMGYCIREFGLFLQEVDPKKVWAHLSARVNPSDSTGNQQNGSGGDLCFACPKCIQGSRSSTSAKKASAY